MSKIVTRTIDLSNPPKLSEEAKSRLAKLNEAAIYNTPRKLDQKIVANKIE